MKRSRMKRPKSFSQRFPKGEDGPRYGLLFQRVREMPCWLAVQQYWGPGHESCGPGAQGGHTAHHLHRLDEHGMIPGCGRAHDLYVLRGGDTAVDAFLAFLERYSFTLQEVGDAYVRRARGEIDATLDMPY